MVITALTRNQVYRQRYRGFESHPLRQKSAPSRWVGRFSGIATQVGGIRKAALGGMPQPPWLFRRKGIPPTPPSSSRTAQVRDDFFMLRMKKSSLTCSVAPPLKIVTQRQRSRFCFCSVDGMGRFSGGVRSAQQTVPPVGGNWQNRPIRGG